MNSQSLSRLRNCEPSRRVAGWLDDHNLLNKYQKKTLDVLLQSKKYNTPKLISNDSLCGDPAF